MAAHTTVRTRARRAPVAASVGDLLTRRAQASPATTAFTFVGDGSAADRHVTYGELERDARALARVLRPWAGSRALLLLPSSPRYVTSFFACVYAGVLPVPLVPPKPGRDHGRCAAVAVDCAAALALAEGPPAAPALLAAPALGAAHWIDVTTIAADVDDGHDVFAPVDADAPVYLQYTSGSTRTPRGVIVTHRSLLHNLDDLHSGWAHTAGSRLLTWLPPFHDMGLIYGLLSPIHGGFRCYSSTPASFIQRPARWLELVSRHHITHSIGPNFAYDLCQRKVNPETTTLDLRSWRVAVNGAEPVDAATLARFARTFASCGFDAGAFAPGYGLAEATLKVCAVGAGESVRVKWIDRDALARHRVQDAAPGGPDARAIVGCGRPRAGTRLRIVDPETCQLAPPGAIGEVWVSSPSVAAGYWNRPAESDAVFRAVCADVPGMTWLRTGDLGFLDGGELFVTGRLKDLVIVAGRNHYPQDIEATVEACHPALVPGGGAAFSIERDGGGEDVVIVHEADVGAIDLPGDRLCERIRTAVAQEHDLDACAIRLIVPRTLSKTSSGKVARSRMRARYVDGDLEDVASWTRAPQEADAAAYLDAQGLRDWLASLVAGVLGIARGRIDLEMPLWRQGLTSLGALELAHAVQAGTGVELGRGVLLGEAPLTEVAAQLDTAIARVASPTAVATGTTGSDYPATPSQRALLWLDATGETRGATNVTCLLRVRGGLSLSALADAWARMGRRHPMLTATFRDLTGDTTVRLDRRRPLALVPIDARAWSHGEIAECVVTRAHEPFALAEGPPARLFVLQVSAAEWRLLLVAHHNVADLWSIGVLLEDLFGAYVGRPLPPVTSDAARCAAALAARLDGEEGLRLERYWRDELGGELPTLALPVDRPRAAETTYRGDAVDWRIGGSLVAALEGVVAREGTSLPMACLAVYALLLGRYADQREVVVGMPSPGRHLAETRAVVGYFVNVLPIRVRWDGQDTFASVLRTVKTRVHKAYDHEGYPFALMSAALARPDQPSRAPFCRAVFTFQAAPGRWAEALGAAAAGQAGVPLPFEPLDIAAEPVPVRAAQFDLSLALAGFEDGLAARLTFNADLFDGETATALARHFEQLAAALASSPDRPLATVSLLSEQERAAIVQQRNDTAAPYDLSAPLHAVIARQALRTPGAPAVIAGGRTLSLGALTAAAHGLAARLGESGIGPEDLVGVSLHRSPELLIALLGVLSAGAAYVALDPDQPRDRLLNMAEQANLRAVVTAAGDEEPWLNAVAEVLTVGCEDPEPGRSRTRPAADARPENPAYVIFTSGSTGRPKGVVTPHRGIVNRLLWMQETFALTAEDRVLQKTPIGFDVSLWELFWPLMFGAPVVLATPGGHRDPRYLADLVRSQRITIAHFVPSMLAAFLDEPASRTCDTLRVVVCSGEALSLALQKRVSEVWPQVSLHNLYGPTEASVDVTHWACRDDEPGAVPIGRPVANTGIYVLDGAGEPVPDGVTGDLYIAGVGLARGYVGSPELTAERFVPCPFGAPGSRMYCSGDRARYRRDGAIEYLGRRDHQVKIRGCRIELAEVEAACRAHPGVRDCVVHPQECGADWQLVAYVATDDTQERASVGLRRHLEHRLPGYMIPAGVVALERLPLLSNGKIDRARLPRWQPSVTTAAPPAPLSEAERRVTALWCEMLGLDHVGRDDNFFRLGGHSLLLMQMAARLRDVLQADLPLPALFETPTIASWSAAAERGPTTTRETAR